MAVAGDGGVVREAVQIGRGRPPLPLVDLPEPEEVFRVPRIDFKAAITAVIGPSLIALGLSIGSGEWLLGPLAVAQYGFVGIGWVILLSAVLQTFYNVEITRYVMATGEVPVLGWARVPPGWWLWVPVALLMVYFANIWGGWDAGAGEGLYVFLTGWSADGSATVHVFVNPLVPFVWLGAAVALFGGVVAAWPARQARFAPAAVPARGVVAGGD